MPNVVKIGEGTCSEVFMYRSSEPTVLKIIPIEGGMYNGVDQKRFRGIMQEIVISINLSDLRIKDEDSDYCTDGFVKVKRVKCVKGKYPQYLIDAWELHRDSVESRENAVNDHPDAFDRDQLYVVFELCICGRDLEAYVFKNAEQTDSVFSQVS